jgi:hypothetical protein
VNLVPELALIVGEHPPVAELPAQEAQRRFHLVFRRFLGVFALVVPWTRPVREAIEPARRAFRLANEQGDPTFAASPPMQAPRTSGSSAIRRVSREREMPCNAPCRKASTPGRSSHASAPLILNAVDAMSEPGGAPRELSISSRRDGTNEILVEVRDSGHGLLSSPPSPRGWEWALESDTYPKD